MMHSNKYLYVGSLGLFLALIHLSGCRPHGKNMPASHHGLSHGFSRMSSIQALIEEYVLMVGEMPGGSRDEATMNGIELYDLFKTMKIGNADFVTERTRKEIMTDPWEIPYNIQFKKDDSTSGDGPRAYDVTVWSCGPNRRDERTGGDDLVRRFRIRIGEAKPNSKVQQTE